MEAHLKKIQFKDYYVPQEYVANPKYTSIDQINSDYAKFTRTRGSLLPLRSEINLDSLPEPGLKWMEKGAVGKFQDRMKDKLINELKQCETN